MLLLPQLIVTMNTILSSIRIPSMPVVGKRLKSRAQRDCKKVAAMTVKETAMSDQVLDQSISIMDHNESVNSIDIPMHIKSYNGPLSFQSHSVTSIQSDNDRTRRVSFHLDAEVHHYQKSTENVEHSKLYYSSQDYKQFQREAHKEEVKKKSEEKLKSSNKRIVDEDTEDLIRCIASQFSLKIQYDA